MSFQIVVQPSGRSFTVDGDETLLAAGIRQGLNMPYGCKDGACGSCKCKKISGEVQLGTYQTKALSDEERAQGWVLTCRATALSDVVLESKQVTSADALPIKKMPVRVASLEKVSGDVMRIFLQLPATEVMQYHAGQYVEFLLRDGSRRAYSMANAPHTLAADAPKIELHLRHMPGGKFTDHVFGAMKEKDIQRIEGPHGSFYLREDSDAPMVLLASGTGFAPIKALLEHMQHKGINRPTRLYWGGASPLGSVHERLGAGPVAADAKSAIHPRGVRCLARRPLDGPNRLCPCGRVARHTEFGRPPGVCLRCADRDRVCQTRLHRQWIARGGILCRLVHQ
jgi:CDP-4-dehydro-6-deoxyglucose reductase